MGAPEAVVAELKAKHGDRIHELEHQGHVVVVKRPNRETWKRFKAQQQDEHKRPLAAENLLLACVVWPDRAGVEAMLDDYPALTETFGSAICELAGLSDKPEKKAL